MNLHGVTGVFSHVPLDWIVIAVFFVIVTLESLRAGSAKATALALALPPAFLALGLLPHTWIVAGFLAKLSSSAMQVGVFVVLLAVFSFFVYRMLSSYGPASASLPQAIIAGFGATAVLLVFWVQVPPLESLWHLGSPLQGVFSESYRLLWLVGAYLGLAFIRT